MQLNRVTHTYVANKSTVCFFVLFLKFKTNEQSIIKHKYAGKTPTVFM